MSNLEIIMCEEGTKENPVIGNLEYGTFVTDVPNGNGCVYIKVKKAARKNYRHGLKSNNGLGLEWDSGYCVLLNLKYGTLRQIPGSTRVLPLKPELKVSPLKSECWHTVQKNYCSAGE